MIKEIMEKLDKIPLEARKEIIENMSKTTLHFPGFDLKGDYHTYKTLCTSEGIKSQIEHLEKNNIVYYIDNPNLEIKHIFI